MTGREVFASIVMQVGIAATIRAAWASRGSGLTGFCSALSDDGFVVWYDCDSDSIKAVRASVTGQIDET